MLMRFSILAFLVCIVPALASTPSDPRQQVLRPSPVDILLMAQREMPLPVLRVATWRSDQAKRLFVVEMSTAGLSSAKDPIMRLTFEIRGGGLDNIEQALHEVSVFVKAFVEDMKNDPTPKEIHWESGADSRRP
jgi:hypothetical protein